MKINNIQNRYDVLGSNRFANPVAERQAQENRAQSKEKRQLINALKSSETADKQESYSTRIINDSLSHAQTVSAERTKNKSTSMQTKKVKYNYKAISTQINRAKSSVSAKQVVIKAKRLVAQLKRQRASGEYDDDEMQAAIDHAKAMERVAKKKVNHLIEEEMAKASGGACLGELEEEKKTDRLDAADGEELEKQTEEQDYAQQSENDVDEESYAELMNAAMQEVVSDYGEDMLAEFSQDMQEAMSEMLDEDILEDLQDSMAGVVHKDMDPADLEMMKLKHRTKEHKEMAQADAKYLKAVFDKLQADKQSITGGGATMSGNTDIAGPASGMSAPVGGGFDISI